MNIQKATLVTSVLMTASVSHAAVSCAEFVAFPPDAQTKFIVGFLDGVGGTLGVLETVTRQLSARAVADDRKAITGVQEVVRGVLSQGGRPVVTELAAKAMAACTRRENAPPFAGNAMIDALMGR